MVRVCSPAGSLAVLLALAGCGQVEQPALEPQPGDPPVATFTATGGGFSGPDTVAAGAVRVRLEAPDGGLEHLSLVRLEEGHTVAEFLTAVEVHYPPYWARFLGGPNAPRPGTPAEAVVALAPGNYAAVSMVLGAEGLPRVRRGMVRPLTVVDSGPGVALPTHTTLLQLYDYGFHLAAPLLPLSQVVKVENLSPQRHEVVLVRLAPDRTPQEMADYLLDLAAGRPVGVAPGDLVGGVAPLSQGQSALWTVSLSLGSYALLCLLADDGDGRPHTQHGHMMQVNVVTPDQLIPPDSGRP